MTNNTQRQIDQINIRYVEVARRNGLNPVWLREIVDLHNRGFNYSQIAQRKIPFVKCGRRTEFDIKDPPGEMR